MKREVAYLDSLLGSGIRPGLARMRALLHAAGDPHRKYPTVIVAGTNGKGSTASTLESILRTAAHRVAFYSSPHLVDLRERWRIDGEDIGEEAFERAVTRLEVAARRAGIRPTYFEALTLIAFIAFADAAVDLAVLEVGMGGRLDATNVTRPLVAVVTAVGLDHQQYLGNTLRAIAHEKAGVIHRGCVALTSNDDEVIVEEIAKRAAMFDVPLHLTGGEVAFEEIEPRPTHTRAVMRTKKSEYRIDSPLAGLHQIENLGLAARTAETLSRHFGGITTDAIERGIAKTRWRGRLERFAMDGTKLYVDGAHNAHAARCIVQFVERQMPRPRTLVFGMMSDKDVAESASILFPHFDRVIATHADDPRAADTSAIASIGKSLGIEVLRRREPERAIDEALSGEPKSILIAGSLYLAGAAIAYLDRLRNY